MTSPELPASGTIPVFKNDPILVLALGFLTCGLYLIYWNMKVAEVINAVAGRPMISQPVALVAGCCMPINVYFYYVCGQALPAIGERTGKRDLGDKTTLLVVLGIFVPMVSAMILQGHINELYEKSG
ncbi:MAG TPA: DUF4234 domain-containing protein [Polyangiales bacterium]|nr:DUF4234 domain-containing protein [Polyangiales bacterium]